MLRPIHRAHLLLLGDLHRLARHPLLALLCVLRPFEPIQQIRPDGLVEVELQPGGDGREEGLRLHGLLGQGEHVGAELGEDLFDVWGAGEGDELVLY